MPADENCISERDFEDVWGVYVKPSGDLFEFADVRDQPPEHVWTIVDSGDDSDGNWYAQPGFYILNKLGYVMTRKPWSDSTPDAIYFLDDFEHEPDESSVTKIVPDTFLHTPLLRGVMRMLETEPWLGNTDEAIAVFMYELNKRSGSKVFEAMDEAALDGHLSECVRFAKERARVKEQQGQ